MDIVTQDTSILILAVSIVGCYLAGLITANYSHVDRLWSILPPIYALVWLLESGTYNPRLIIGAILVVMWGTRLTWNFARKGGYNFNFRKGFYEEDYRWEYLRNKIPGRFLFEVFNLLFICVFQLILIWAFTSPLSICKIHNTPLDSWDIVIIAGFILAFSIETIADVQQFNYYKLREENNGNKRLALGYNTFGLWKFSRHPNYFGELSQWAMIFLLSVNAEKSLNLSGLGIIVLIALFIGSSNFSEKITASKYKSYAEWKKVTPRFFPILTWFTKRESKRRFLQKFE